MRQRFSPVTVLLTAAVLALPCLEVARAEVSQESLKSISIPDNVETSFGTLEFFDGVPAKTTVEKIYDNLDRMRGNGGVSRQCRRRFDVQRAYRSGRCRVQGGEQDRPLRTVVGFADPSGHRQHLDPLCLYLHSISPTMARRSSRSRPACSAFSTTPGSALSAIWASPGRTRARAASISCCRPATRGRSPKGISC